MGRPSHDNSNDDRADVLRAPPVRRQDSLPMKAKVSTTVRSNTINKAKEEEKPVNHQTSRTVRASRKNQKSDDPTATNDNDDKKKKDTKNSSNNNNMTPPPETYRESRLRQTREADEESTSQCDESDDEEYQPGAHFVGGTPGVMDDALSMPSYRSENNINNKSTDFVPSSRGDDEPGLTTAIPVDEEEAGEDKVVSEEAKAKIQKEARDEVLKGVVKAEEENEDELKQKAAARRRWKCAIGSVILLPIVTGAALAVYFYRQNVNNDETFAVTRSPTMAPSAVPLIFNPGETEHNNFCEDAFSLEETVGIPIFGSTMNATKDDVAACEIVSTNGNGVWYRLTGDNRRMMASTCDKTFFDTQISIFRGACGKLQCVSANDQISCGNGDQSQVAWFAEPEIDYFIFVHGHRESTGLFELAVDSMDDNSECDNAQALAIDTAPTFGSTRGVANQNVENCGSARQTAGGVWYTVMGTGDIVSASLITEGNTAFRGQISVFVGSDCGDLQCVDGSVIGFGSWVTQPGTQYFILVHGQGIIEGDFLLQMTTVVSPTTPPVDVSDPCPALDTAPLVAVGSSVSGSTKFEPIYNVESCGNLVFSTAPGMWFRVVGTGGALAVSTCDEEGTNFDTQISVFTGLCDSLQCLDGNDQGGGDCGDSSSVSWFSLAGEEYFVLVHGFGERVGDFVLNIEEISIESSEKCDTSIELLPDGTTRLGATQGNNVTNSLPDCTTSIDGPGAWYILEGNGGNITASTCQQSSQASSSSITIYQGGDCGNLKCVEGTVTPCGSQSSVAFPTSDGENYFVYVQTPEVSDGAFRELQASRVPEGAFTLTAEVTPANDICEQASGPLSPGGNTIFGSTRSATPRDGVRCSPNDFLGRGVWYTVIGTGQEMTASTCSEFTNFVSYIEIFSGGCGSVSCVESASVSSCEDMGSVARWDSVEGAVYYVYVTGIGFEEYGNFALTIGAGNDFCFGAQEIPNNGSVIIGSTANATYDGSAPGCGNVVTSPGVWYKYSPFGAASELTVSTCHSETDYETEITVYRGGCDNLECLDQVSTGLCGDQKSTVTWTANREDEFYYIHVHGYGIGNFGINVIEGNRYCESSNDFALQGPQFSFFDIKEYFLSGSTVGMPLVNAPGCGIERLSPGVWFTFVGSGTNIFIDACNDEFFFNSQITVFKGLDCEADLECIDTTESFFTCEVGLTIETIYGQNYFILVHGAQPFDQGQDVEGEFGFTIRQDEQAFCEQSIAVPFSIEDGAEFLIEDSLEEGGESAIVGDGQCGQARDFGIGGHWYSVVGTGKNITASTCYAGTEIDSQLSVYAGSCRALECIAGNDDVSSSEFEGEFDDGTIRPTDDEVAEIPNDFVPVGGGFLDDGDEDGGTFGLTPLEDCGLTSTISWSSDIGVVYYVFVHVFEGDVGNYVLSIASE